MLNLSHTMIYYLTALFLAVFIYSQGNYTQEIGIYSLLQPEEPAYSSRNVGYCYNAILIL